ncbi:(3S)-malyl-CoA thioesterase [Variibacter gotjawalensis]|uniref:(3S)-malyl-CoA thioesterase n=1 Tax=Variibacter gotjawalensis TaxID=1333996 RepID=A0A0S3PRQ0_9BRAD|nr:CoA ester lyase [Variibacter gotjawalensis]NIK48936.1 citrate lyase subunit beta/citryl-CoA lyase [Variibacter gotjawalensis]RZS50792.1 citrate lyase subunit beta/citryl-CoA lyase [Variibacter gotjawalensis]BAT58626.1 (3S)-malyl-CoA thioesterase [Variibacter gotjawalensis]
MSIRPRRSVLYMPGSNARAIEKAKTLDCDGIVIDLEDAVAPDAKKTAREQAIAAVTGGGFGGRELFIRVNGIETQWGFDDLTAAVKAAPDGIVLPKVGSAELLEKIGTRLLDMGADRKIRIWAMIETPIAILRIGEIASAAKDSETRLAGFILGTNDLVKESYGRIVKGRGPLLPWIAQTVAAARAFNIQVLDGVYNDIADTDGLRAECEQGRDFGFDGKTLIHPSQIETCNAVYSPAPNEVAEARKTIAAFDLPENKDKGVIRIEGKMVERMHADMARRMVSIADAISSRNP